MGRVEGVYLAPETEAPCEPVERARFAPGRGPEGDRKFRPDGTEPYEPGTGRDITLVEAEAIEGLAGDTGIDLSPGEARRNVVTRAIAPNDLVRKPARGADVRSGGAELRHPDRHLEVPTRP